jgi:hypothetical protein
MGGGRCRSRCHRGGHRGPQDDGGMLLFWSGALLVFRVVEAEGAGRGRPGERRDRYRIDLEVDYGGARYIRATVVAVDK